MSLFSIVIPVYNVEAYLRKCLDSVLGQTCSDWECICVDDGSTDRSGAILDEYAEKLGGKIHILGTDTSTISHFSFLTSHFKVIHQMNGGVSAARNAALDLAKGEWVQFLDSDDSLELDFLEKLAEAIQTNPEVDAIEHTAIYCYGDSRKVYGDKGRLPPAGVLTAQQILADPFGRKYTNLARCSCYKIFRREVIERNHLRFTPGIPVGEDSLFATQFYALANKVAVCPEAAGYVRIFREGSALMSIRPEKLIPQIKASEVLYETYRSHPSRGLAVSLSASIVVLSYLGKEYGVETRQICREAVLASSFYCGRGLRFVLFYGTWKMRLFALCMIVSPRTLKRKILDKL